jgi:hypothetical protein
VEPDCVVVQLDIHYTEGAMPIVMSMQAGRKGRANGW